MRNIHVDQFFNVCSNLYFVKEDYGQRSFNLWNAFKKYRSAIHTAKNYQ